MDDDENAANFKARMAPHLESLMQYSLGLTRNGRDATRLLRDSLAEAYGQWDKATPIDGCGEWIYALLTKRYWSREPQPDGPILPDLPEKLDEKLALNLRVVDDTSTYRWQQAYGSGGDDEQVNYLQTIAELPQICRSAMILSYVERFSTEEIADLAGAEPPLVAASLDRGRQFIREELLTYLMDQDNPDTTSDREELSQ